MRVKITISPVHRAEYRHRRERQRKEMALHVCALFSFVENKGAIYKDLKALFETNIREFEINDRFISKAVLNIC